MKSPAVYMLASERNGTIYVGVTSNLAQRIYEHKEGIHEGFSKKYNCNLLVWYEPLDRMDDAITREKQLKKTGRNAKIKLIEAQNPNWDDLYFGLNS
ncbi:MAG: GIY-YIG nuclease family protein [Alphaproteobacteria bacterium]|nr:GIY-YIG nuclease family protein [Alphaproteobacteria bacterium]